MEEDAYDIRDFTNACNAYNKVQYQGDEFSVPFRELNKGALFRIAYCDTVYMKMCGPGRGSRGVSLTSGIAYRFSSAKRVSVVSKVYIDNIS